MSDRDYYEILGLTPHADGAMVDQAYWHLARKYQALAATNFRAQRMLDELNEAYGVLGNPKLREQYDAFRDDVLIRRGMIQPVRAKVEPAPAKPDKERRRRSVALPRLHVQHWRTYGVSTIIAALALAAGWQGVSLLFVVPALVAGLLLATLPTLGPRVPDITSMSFPTISAPHLSLPQLPDVGMPLLNDPDAADVDADAVRQSTAATIERWRKSMGLRQGARGVRPDTTLVDIVAGERRLDDDDEPLRSVIETLKGAHRTTRR